MTMRRAFVECLAAGAIAVFAAGAASADTIVVTPANMEAQGWKLAMQQGVKGGWDTPAEPAQMPVAEFVTGPGLPPAGDGSFKMQVFYSDNNPLSKIYLGTNSFSVVELKRITRFEYWTYIHYRDYDRGRPPMIEIITDSGSPSAQQRRFWFYPGGYTVKPAGYSGSATWPLNLRQWQRWDLMDPNGWWEMVGTSSSNYYGNWEWLRKRYDSAGETMKLATPYVGDYRDPMNPTTLQIANQTGTSIAIKIGSGQVIDTRYGPWWYDQSAVWAYVDRLIIGIDGVDYEYDFESTPLPVVTINNRAARDPIMAQARNNFRFAVFGKVNFNEFFTGDQFTVDDGSGRPILVKATGHSVNPFDYVKATGALNPATNPPTLESRWDLIETLAGIGDY